MANLFEKAGPWLAKMEKTGAGVEVSYTRGATTLSVTAVIGETAYQSEQKDGAWFTVGECDFLIDVADLVALGTPQIGDRITRTFAGGVVVFEAMQAATNPNGLAWRFSDGDRLKYRITTKRKA